MKKLIIAGLAFGLVVSGMTGTASALNVTATNNGDTLVNALLGSGISLVSGSVSYTGANSAASGTFTNGGNIGISNGIILTTGNASGAVGPNNVGNYSGSGASTSLAFDFTTAAGDLFFNYVFASEEYNEWVGSQYNDYFKFYLDGVNIALIPNSTTQVAINNVNLSSNSSYYRNNASGSINTQYDGLTTVLTAQKLGLGAGQHHIQMYITDMGDTAWDSGVFIAGNTFSDQYTDPTAPVPEPGTIALLGLGMAGLAVYGKRRQKKA